MEDCPVCSGSGLLGCSCKSINSPRINLHCEDCIRKGYYCSTECASIEKEDLNSIE
ncbi:MAG: hypothetical protein ACRCST_07450 [Turicibacter sp.]